MLQFLVKGTWNGFLLWFQLLMSRAFLSQFSIICVVWVRFDLWGRIFAFHFCQLQGFLAGHGFGFIPFNGWPERYVLEVKEGSILFRTQNDCASPLSGEAGIKVCLGWSLPGFCYPANGPSEGGAKKETLFLSWILNFSLRHRPQFQRENSSLKCPTQITKNLELPSSTFSFINL